MNDEQKKITILFIVIGFIALTSISSCNNSGGYSGKNDGQTINGESADHLLDRIIADETNPKSKNYKPSKD